MQVSLSAEKTASRIIAYDIARGGAVALVVFMHVTQQLQLATQTPTAVLLFNWCVAAIRMPLLFLLSGVLANVYLDRDRSKVTRRAANFVWLLSVWSGVAVLIGSLDLGLSESLQSFVMAILLPESPLWFIWALAAFTLTIPIAARFSHKTVIVTSLIVATLAYSSSLQTLVPDIPVSKTARHCIFFYVGLLYARAISDLITARRTRTMFQLMVLALGCHVLNGVTAHFFSYDVLLIPEKLSLSLLAIMVVAQLPETRITPFLCWLGANTLPILVGHMLFVKYLVSLSPKASYLEISIGITVISIGGSICLERCAKMLGANWMYRLPNFTVRVGTDAAISNSSKSQGGIRIDQLYRRT